jgi:hypothetical protein
MPQKTTEIQLVLQCSSNPNGGLDVATVLNDAPSIDDLSIRPSKFHQHVRHGDAGRHR